MSLVKLIDTDIDHIQLWLDVRHLLGNNNLWDHRQVSLTSIDGSNDWQCSVGRLVDLPHPERYYGCVNQSLAGTYLAQCILRYPQYYRWRLMKLQPKHTYTIHNDNLDKTTTNHRLHIPVVTNPGCLMYFYPEMPTDNSTLPVTFYHMAAGNSYEANTTGLHCAMNHGTSDRYHIVGVRYQNLNSDK